MVFEPGSIADLKSYLEISGNLPVAMPISPDSSQWEAIEARGGNVDTLWSILSAQLTSQTMTVVEKPADLDQPSEVLMSVYLGEGWSIRMTDAHGIPFWSYLVNENRFADHPNFVPLDANYIPLYGHWELKPIVDRLPPGRELKPVLLGGVPYEAYLEYLVLNAFPWRVRGLKTKP